MYPRIGTQVGTGVATASTPGPGTFARGVHPPHHKAMSADTAIEVLPTPPKVIIPLLQHLGAPCKATVKPKQEVDFGQVIGQAEAFVSAPVHASVAGTVSMPVMTTLPNGRHVQAIPITPAAEQPAGRTLWDELFSGEWPKGGLDRFTPEQICQAVRDAGIVGMGGAAFPTHVKLTRNEKRPVDTLIVNGCECEPYLTSDYRLMLQAPAPIVTGALLAAQAAGAKRIFLAIEDNKPLAIDKLRRAADRTGIQVVAVKTKYPQGGERQLVPAVLDREVPTGGLPLDVGVVVVNVATATAIAQAVLRGKPLTHRVVAVSGAGIAHPRNLLVPIGVTVGQLLEHCGGLKGDAVRVVAGGPMMGFAVGDLDTPITKGTGGVTVLTDEEVVRPVETACVRCGRCVDVCPLHLVPTRIALAVREGDLELAKRYHLQACCECGCCGYACPAGIPLVQLIRQGKAEAAG